MTRHPLAGEGIRTRGACCGTQYTRNGAPIPGSRRGESLKEVQNDLADL